MPAIPNVPGVPILSSYSIESTVLMIADAILLAVFGIGPIWGIFQDGIPISVIFADNMVSFELKQDFPISDYPVEQGGFQSYNKVQLPTEIRVSMSAGGSVPERQAFLASIDAVMSTTALYDIVTPEAVYVGYNFSHRDFRRTSKNGVGLITVDLWLMEVRVTSSATFINTQSPAVAGKQALGNVQPQSNGPGEATDWHIGVRPMGQVQ